jgi:pyruvate, water dikinase
MSETHNDKATPRVAGGNNMALGHTLFFDTYIDDHHPVVGGKCASLGSMTIAGLPVPTGFAVTTEAFIESLDATGAHAKLLATLAGLDVTDVVALADVGAQCRSIVMESGLAPAAEAAIRAGYDVLCANTGVDRLPVAVRSSATAEDQPDASFAGQQDTYLWVRGSDDVVQHVLQCWASMFTDRAISYRYENGYPHEDVAMSVAVQQMVMPTAAGVAFTLNPTSGDRSVIVIDSAFGLGESVVSGSVTPDNYMVDKVMFEIVRRTVSAKELEVVLDGDTVVHVPLDESRSTQASLTDAQIKAVARLARQAEKHFGRPQDVEWAVTVDADGEHTVHLLQSRPETVWSNRPRQVSNGVTSVIDGILSTLLSPVKVK